MLILITVNIGSFQYFPPHQKGECTQTDSIQLMIWCLWQMDSPWTITHLACSRPHLMGSQQRPSSPIPTSIVVGLVLAPERECPVGGRKATTGGASLAGSVITAEGARGTHQGEYSDLKLATEEGHRVTSFEPSAIYIWWRWKLNRQRKSINFLSIFSSSH